VSAPVGRSSSWRRDDVGEAHKTRWLACALAAAAGSPAGEFSLLPLRVCLLNFGSLRRKLIKLYASCFVWRVMLMLKKRMGLCCSGYSWSGVVMENTIVCAKDMKYFQFLVWSKQHAYAALNYYCGVLICIMNRVSTWFCYSSFVHFSGLCMHLGVIESHCKDVEAMYMHLLRPYEKQ
jgi:hypothetical protein